MVALLLEHFSNRKRSSTGRRGGASTYFFSIFATVVFAALFSQAANATNPPTIGVGAGGSTFQNQTSVTIAGDSGASLYYTLDGSTPSSSSTAYSAQFTVNNYTTVKAISYVSGVASTVTTAYVAYEVPRPNLQLWLKPENITTSGSLVTGWNDVSGYSTKVTQTVTANQPTYVSSAVNGYASANFNGAATNSSYLNIAQGSSNAPFLTNLSTGFAIFAVINPNTSTSAKTFMTASNTGVTDMVSTSTIGGNMTFNVNNGTTAMNLTTTTSPITTGKFQVINAVLNGSNVGTIDVNGVTIASATLQALNNTARTVDYIGSDNAKTSTNFWGGQLVELLVYSTGTTFQTQTAEVEAYLANRYQLNTSQSTATPVISVATSTLSAPQYVAIWAPQNATVFITQDGTTPTTSSPTYQGPVNIYYTQTLKAMAVVNGIQSSVATATYTLNSTQWPAPSATDTTPLQINLQLPTTAIPQ